MILFESLQHVARSLRSTALVAALAASFACSSDHPLDVYVFTDLDAVDEFYVVVASAPFETYSVTQTYRLTANDVLGAGVRVASWPAIPEDDYFVEVRALAAGTPVISRALLLKLEAPLALDVGLSASCATTTCPRAGDASDLGQCVGGDCVNEGCSSVFPSACPRQCAHDHDCTPSSLCGSGHCIEGTCIKVESACSAAETCRPTAGCVPNS